MAVRKYFSFVLLFALVVIADAYLFYTLYETTQSDEEDLLKAVWEDMVYFPVPQSSYDTKGYGVSFGDSWMAGNGDMRDAILWRRSINGDIIRL